MRRQYITLLLIPLFTVLLPLTACGKHYTTKTDYSIKLAEFSPRAEIKETSLTERELWEQGYARIGVISTTNKFMSCRAENREDILKVWEIQSEITIAEVMGKSSKASQPGLARRGFKDCIETNPRYTSHKEMMEKAAELGGDLLQSTQKDAYFLNLYEGACTRYGYDDPLEGAVAAMENYNAVAEAGRKGGWSHNVRTGFCLEREIRISEKEKSNGTVWRQEPELAKKQSLIFYTINESSVMVKRLLAEGLDPNTIDELRIFSNEPEYTPLCAAAKNYDIASTLLKAGGDLNRTDNIYVQPLVCALQNGSPKVVQLYIDSGAQTPKYGLMNWAIDGKNIDVIKYLFSKGVPLPEYLDRGTSKIPTLSWVVDAPDLLRFLINNGVEPCKMSKNETVPFIEAAKIGNTESVKIFLGAGCDSEQPDTYWSLELLNNSAIQTAAENGHAKIVKLMLKHGANPHPYSGKNSPLWSAVAGYKLPVIKLLLEWGANPNEGISDKRPLCLSVLGLSSFKGNLDAMKLLIEAGADVNICDGEPLYRAIEERKPRAVLLLLHYNAHTSIGDHHLKAIKKRIKKSGSKDEKVFWKDLLKDFKYYQKSFSLRH